MLAWRNDAACGKASEEQLEKFFPSGRPAHEPKTFCAGCPVRDECLEFALDSPWRPGAIVAGYTPRELEPMWRSRHPEDTHAEIQQLLGLR